MRSSRDGRRRDRPAAAGRSASDGGTRSPGTSRVLAIDLGGSGTRAWVCGGALLGAGSVSHDSASRPVRRGRIVDPESCAVLLARVADTALGADRRDSVIVLSRPVLAGLEHRAQARELLARLGPSSGMVLSSAEAAAACAGPAGSGPVLVVDMGAELTEVALLVDGVTRDARQADSGLTDLDPDALPAQLAGAVVDMIACMWREDRHGAVRGALRRGPVLTGGGALRSDVTGLIAARLGAAVRVDPDPSTAVVRGAALLAGRVPAGTRPGPAPAVPARRR
ncbi:rod shape-determining protein MreC [Streptomyces sp. NBC_00178]|uniref:rod shape-determining protein MreC n=1 Tax=Streptomyces sp. NBC_00178 TaxID=2975672 RepID=UPI002E28F512|nr:rod shape-determining protein MreC [Streptomyces sp. NBC_00178]